MTVPWIIILLLSYAMPVSCSEKPVIVKAEVDRDSISIGDKVRYSITVDTIKGVEIKFPSFAENLAGFAIKDFGSREKKFFKKRRLIRWYILDTYMTGTYTIPQAVIKYRRKGEKWKEIEANEVKVEVKSLLEGDVASADIRDIKGPVNFSRKVSLYVVSGALLLFIAGGVAVLLMRRKRKVEAIPTRPAHEIAYEALEELKKKDFLKNGKIKEFYIELSFIVRHYLENRFNIRAPEMTTEEFLISVKGSGVLSHEHKNLLRDFLSHCDLVKFATYHPPEKEVELSLQAAERLIDQTKIEKEK